MKEREVFMKAIGTNIRFFREQNHLSQEKLATLMGVDRSLVSKWERGTVPITADRMMKIASLFGISVSLLYNVTEMDL